MATCVAQQSSLLIPNKTYCRKLRAATCDSSAPVMTSLKRHLSEQNECHNSMTKLSNDDIDANKRFRTGNYII